MSTEPKHPLSCRIPISIMNELDKTVEVTNRNRTYVVEKLLQHCFSFDIKKIGSIVNPPIVNN